MASKVVKKSAFKLPNQSKNESKLGFITSKDVVMADRDFGLMKITADKASTPYPRQSDALDIRALKARLHAEWKNQDREDVESMEPQTHFSQAAILKTKPYDKMLSGTPHPLKGVAVNPKLLKKHLEAYEFHGSDAWTSKRLSALSDTDFFRKPLKPVRISGRLLRTLKPILQSSTHKEISKKSHVSGKSTKKVTIMTSNLHLNNSEDSMNADPYNNALGVDGQPILSFNERRQQFCAGEFTIAKNGKKMSDSFIGELKYSIDPNDHTLTAAVRASHEIELFMRKQGLIKIHAGTVAITNRVRNLRTGSIISFDTIKAGPSNESLQKKKHITIRSDARNKL